MRAVKTSVRTRLGVGWAGEDATEFTKKWSDVIAKDSIAVKFCESLETYSDSLVACAGEYEKAQAEVYNRATRI